MPQPSRENRRGLPTQDKSAGDRLMDKLRGWSNRRTAAQAAVKMGGDQGLVKLGKEAVRASPTSTALRETFKKTLRSQSPKASEALSKGLSRGGPALFYLDMLFNPPPPQNPENREAYSQSDDFKAYLKNEQYKKDKKEHRLEKDPHKRGGLGRKKKLDKVTEGLF